MKVICRALYGRVVDSLRVFSAEEMRLDHRYMSQPVCCKNIAIFPVRATVVPFMVSGVPKKPLLNGCLSNTYR